MVEYLKGEKLYGDDFSLEQIKEWFEEEKEGYADLGSKNKNSYTYGYHMMNEIHGYSKIKTIHFKNVLGFGSAWGYEFEPISMRIDDLTIIEPSDNLVNNKINNLIPKYIKPSIEGKLPFNDNSFDLITCFGTLHHIPNVSFVISELVRVLHPDGYLLLREPIISMGDWSKQRRGLTKNERGIPISFFEKEFSKYPIKTLSKEYCFTMTSLLQRTIGFMFKKPIYSYKAYVFLDKFISNLLKKNVKYHATRKLNRIAPSSIFYVIKKL